MKWPATATVLSMLTAAIVVLIAMGIFNQPDIVDVRQTGQSVCPSQITKTFDITFANHGNNDARVSVVVRSDAVKFKKAEDSIVIPPSGQPIMLSFDVENKEFPANQVFVDYEWNYKKYWFFSNGGKERCNYLRDSTNSGRLNLVR